MIKKMLMLTALWLSFTGSASAKDIQFNTLYGYSNENKIQVGTGAIFEKFEPNPKDWVGIYKVGDSTAWANVKLWFWAKDFKDVEDGYGDQYYDFKNANLPAGQYVVRYFLNNTYNTRLESKAFTVNELYGYYAPKNNSLYLEVRNKNFNPNPQDWIGIYKKGHSNEWENVREWIWAKDLKKNSHGFYSHSLKNPDLSSGKYEVRYFLNNTFTTHKESKPFKVEIATDNKLYGTHSIRHKTTYIEIRDENFNPNPKDWFGIYEVGDSNDWDNVKLWIWAKDLKESPADGGYHHQFKNFELPLGNYELRYFLNNSFVTDKRSKPFKAQ